MMNQRKQKTLASAFTVLVLAVIFFLMNGSAIPQRDLIAEHYDKIDWMRFTPKPEKVIKPEEASAKAENETEEPLKPAEPAIERIDLDDLAKEMDVADLDLQQTTVAPEGKSSGQSASSRTSLEIDESSLDDFNLAFDDNQTLLKAPGRKRSHSKAGRVALQAGSGEESGSGLGSLGEDVGADLQGLETLARGGSEGKVEVGLKNLADFGDDYEDFSPIFQPLVEWMKRHPAVLPEVVKRFMDYEPGALTSRVRFEVGNKSFDMCLLCVETTMEVRIALMHQRDVTYLIDQGFKKKSNFLRVGNVDVLPGEEILKFDTNLRPAGGQKTKEFYQIFLSWWESVKHEVE